ncbi:glycosyl transferase family 28 [Sneathiella sp. P13V-1]|uniref:glycosyltransferase n=1 Tax=Sneathiella sp. P13V-1 TaxID=2697366 RepID=UPI00187BA48B|nr:glycosyltransferase [Sneathiella sp. P13V-1]MBE7636399.1 glycosyl transferase family 28 [Sneathiella sp. P13V-1]
MIFLTLGTQLPFERLVRAMDSWCAQNPKETVFGQIASVEEGSYEPKNFKWVEFLEPDEFSKMYEESKLVVGHAGMGTIITALVQAKPLLIMPRKASLGEHRNDHQMATAQKFQDRQLITTVFDDAFFDAGMMDAIGGLDHERNSESGKFADDSLIEEIRHFIHS